MFDQAVARFGRLDLLVNNAGVRTFKPLLDVTVEEKLIEEIEAPPTQERRRYYRLTSAGRKLARSESERLAEFLRVARAKKIFRGENV